jgi:hypothetical protein
MPLPSGKVHQFTCSECGLPGTSHSPNCEAHAYDPETGINCQEKRRRRIAKKWADKQKMKKRQANLLTNVS